MAYILVTLCCSGQTPDKKLLRVKRLVLTYVPRYSVHHCGEAWKQESEAPGHTIPTHSKEAETGQEGD